MCTGWDVVLASKPVLHGRGKARNFHVGTNFHQAVCNGQSVVESSGVREIAHGEAVEPAHLASPSFALDLVLNFDPAREHTA